MGALCDSFVATESRGRAPGRSGRISLRIDADLCVYDQFLCRRDPPARSRCIRCEACNLTVRRCAARLCGLFTRWSTASPASYRPAAPRQPGRGLDGTPACAGPFPRLLPQNTPVEKSPRGWVSSQGLGYLGERLESPVGMSRWLCRCVMGEL